MESVDPKRELLRHTVATLAYRGGKAVREAPESFAGFARLGNDPHNRGDSGAHL